MSRYLFSRKAPGPRISGLPRDQREFYEHLGEHSEIRLEPGYNQDEFFDDQFERRAHEKTRTPSANNAINIVPAKQGPWSGNNNLGTERAFAPDENNRQTILKLPEWGFPQVWSVMLDLKSTDTDFTDFDVTAEVEVGSGGALEILDLDWNRGTSFSVVTNALNIIASYSNTTDLPDDLRLTARVGQYPLYGQAPTRTFKVLQPTTGTFIQLVPRYAKAINFLSNFSGAGVDIFDSGVEIRFLGNPGNVATLKAFITGPNLLTRYTGRMIIPGGTNAIAIFNPNFIQPLSCTMVFELGL